MDLRRWRAAERTVELSHGPASYVEFGSGPPLVLLHGVGFPQGAMDWFLVAEELGRDVRVLALDLVGWGSTARLRHGYSFARLVDFVREFQDALGLPSSHVAGFSMGGWVASVLAYESPQRVDKLVLVGSGGISQRPLSMMTDFRPPTVEQVTATIAARTGLGADDAAAWARYAMAKVAGDEPLAAYRRVLAHMSDPEVRMLYNTQRRLPHVTAPTLIVWGEHDQVNDIGMGRRTAELVPDSRLVVLDCGHFVASERPAAFVAAVRPFLRTAPALRPAAG